MHWYTLTINIKHKLSFIFFLRERFKSLFKTWMASQVSVFFFFWNYLTNLYMDLNVWIQKVLKLTAKQIFLRRCWHKIPEILFVCIFFVISLQYLNVQMYLYFIFLLIVFTLVWTEELKSYVWQIKWDDKLCNVISHSAAPYFQSLYCFKKEKKERERERKLLATM